MKSFLRRLTSRSSHPSVASALKQFLPAEQLRHLVQHCPDRRELLDFAAESLGLTPEELLGQMSEVTGVPFVKRVLPMDLSALPSALTLDHFRRIGAIGITQEGFLTGVVCVDPAVAEQVLPKEVSKQVTLGSWSAIQEALKQTEQQEREAAFEQERAVLEAEKRSAQKVLHLIKEQLTQYGVTCARIVFEEAVAEYRFFTPEGRSGKGAIHAQVAGPLCSFLTELAAERAVEFQVETVSADRLFEVSWREQARELSCTEDLEPLEESSRQIVSEPVVLLIDDNSVFRAVLEQFFAKQGIRALHAENGAEALRLLADETPNVVVCDVHMPEMNGQQFVKRFRAEPRFRSTPLLMLTSDDDIEVELAAVDAGADAFICKNEDPRKLCSYVSRFLERGVESPETKEAA